MQQISHAQQKILLVGVGTFGFALLSRLERTLGRQHQLLAWDPDASLVEMLRCERRHPVVRASVRLGERAGLVGDLAELDDSDVVILALDSTQTGDVIAAIAAHIGAPFVVVNTVKGLDVETGRRLSQVVEARLGDKLRAYALLGGLNETDLLADDHVGASLACNDANVLFWLGELLKAENVHLDPTQDLAGAEYATAFGQLLSVMSGLASGARLTESAQARLVLLLAQEIERLAVAYLGAKESTFSLSSPCWANELYMSGAGLGPAREFGVLLGRGCSVDEAVASLREDGRDLEVVRTIKALGKLPSHGLQECLASLFDMVNGDLDRDELLARLNRIPS